jgi:predicted nucleotidyltransferase
MERYYLIMDLGDPTRAITPTLDGTVLAVLAAAGRPMTVGDVAAQAARGSEIGIRRSLMRLVDQGVVTATAVGRNRVHELNRDHVAADVAILLSGLRLEMWKRLRTALAKWRPRPIYACVFGSAARGDGGPESDIDVLLVHPPFPGEKKPSRSATIREVLGNLALDFALPVTTEADASKWTAQTESLHGLVQRWTGNRLQIVDVSVYEWTHRLHLSDGLWDEIARDAVMLIQPNPITFIAEKNDR